MLGISREAITLAKTHDYRDAGGRVTQEAKAESTPRTNIIFLVGANCCLKHVVPLVTH
jgi:hypothetical protein